MNFQDALNRLKAISETLPDDDPDKLEMLNVEGDFSSLMEWALRKRNEAIAQADSCSALKETYYFREKRFQARADDMKDVIRLIMNCAGEKKFQGVSGTVSVKSVPPKPVILDEAMVPDKFFEIKKVLSKTLINEAIKNGESITGVSMDNGNETISIRVK